MERRPVSDYLTAGWWGIGNIAPDEYCTKRDMIMEDYMKGVISFAKYMKRGEELINEVVDVLGQPQKSRPYCESDLTENERRAKNGNPSLFMKKWETMWREWEESETRDTRWFWSRWGKEVAWMWTLSDIITSVFAEDCYSHQSVNDDAGDHVSRLKTMQSTLKESQAYAPARIAQVAAVLKSPRHLSRNKRDWMARTLARVQHTLS